MIKNKIEVIIHTKNICLDQIKTKSWKRIILEKLSKLKMLKLFNANCSGNNYNYKACSGDQSKTITTTTNSTPKWRKYTKYVYYAILFIYIFARRASAASEEVNGGEEKIPGRYQVAKFNFDHVSDVYAITLWILLGSLAKVGKSTLEFIFLMFKKN